MISFAPTEVFLWRQFDILHANFDIRLQQPFIGKT